MTCRPLPDDLGPDPGILDLIGCRPGKWIRGDIANAISRRLDGMHFKTGKPVQNIWRLDKLDPVELDVLAGGEMPEATVKITGDSGKSTHLRTRQGTVGNRDPQHVGVKLKIQPVLQPQWLELLLGQRAAQPPLYLVTELCGTASDDIMIDSVIAVHGGRDDRRRGGTGAVKIGWRRDTGAVRGANGLARRWPGYRIIPLHFIDRDNLVAPFSTGNGKTRRPDKIVGKPEGARRIFGPGQIAGQPDSLTRLDPVGGEGDPGHAGLPAAGRAQRVALMITTSSPRADRDAACARACAGSAVTSSTSRRAR